MQVYQAVICRSDIYNEHAQNLAIMPSLLLVKGS